MLIGFASTLYRENPRHPVFGPPAKGLIRLPLLSSRSNGQCWHNKLKKIAHNIMKQMGSNWTRTGCWFSTTSQIQITNPKGPHSSDVWASITIVRLLVFFSTPTETNWRKLTSHEPTLHPFDHRCHRGHDRHDGSVGCVNGVEHGTFSTKDINEGRKLCSNRCLAMCPGHGVGGECIYTDAATGLLLPCRMVEDHLPKCECTRKCY